MPKAHTAIIVHSKFPAEQRQNELDPDRKRFLIFRPGQQVGGRQFDAILITRQAQLEMFDPQYSDERFVEQAGQWFRDCIECRLSRDGKIAYI